ncbi:hypothetical protein [Embleya sp. NPDC020886]|uniref:hypothetical protein n=1 Tax=Embleya sp. NPDC020886 TaxID=3363980 RepID=UPI0037B2DCFD
METTGVRRLFFLVGAFLVGMLILGGLAFGALQLYLRHPWAPFHRDSRADPGSSEISLKESLKLTGVTLPEGTVNVRYYVKGNAMGTLLKLSYQIPCNSVPAMMEAAKLTVPVAVDSTDNKVRRFAESHGWRPESGPTTAATDTQVWNTTAMVQTLASGNCSVYVDAFN